MSKNIKINCRVELSNLFYYFSLILILSSILTGCIMPENTQEVSISSSTLNKIESLEELSSSNFSSTNQNSSSELSEIPTEIPTPTLVPSPLPTQAGILDNTDMYVNVRILNLRSEGNTNSSIITKIPFRTHVKRIMILDSWSKVVTDNNETGYLFSDYISSTIPPIVVKPTSIPKPTLSPRSMKQWPPESSLDKVFYSAELEKYIGREKTPDSFPLKGITVILDPGHGGKDSGAVYSKGPSPLYEKTLNLIFSLKIGNLLTEMGAEVVYTRDNDSFRGLYYRNALINKFVLEKHKQILIDNNEDVKEVDRLIELLNQVMLTNPGEKDISGRGVFEGLGMNADMRTILDISREHQDIIVMSVHCNAAMSVPSRSGTEIYYGTNVAIVADEKRLLKIEPISNTINPTYQFYDEKARRKFATSIRDELIKKVPLMPMQGTTNGLYPWNFCMIREHNLTSVLIELGYLTNKHDREFLLIPSNQDIMSIAIANSIYNNFCN